MIFARLVATFLLFIAAFPAFSQPQMFRGFDLVNTETYTTPPYACYVATNPVEGEADQFVDADTSPSGTTIAAWIDKESYCGPVGTSLALRRLGSNTTFRFPSEVYNWYGGWGNRGKSPRIVNDGASGWLVVWLEWSGSQQLLKITYSVDDGNTWSPKLSLLGSNGLPVQAQAVSAAAENGKWLITWYNGSFPNITIQGYGIDLNSGLSGYLPPISQVTGIESYARGEAGIAATASSNFGFQDWLQMAVSGNLDGTSWWLVATSTKGFDSSGIPNTCQGCDLIRLSHLPVSWPNQGLPTWNNLNSVPVTVYEVESDDFNKGAPDVAFSGSRWIVTFSAWANNSTKPPSAAWLPVYYEVLNANGIEKTAKPIHLAYSQWTTSTHSELTHFPDIDGARILTPTPTNDARFVLSWTGGTWNGISGPGVVLSSYNLSTDTWSSMTRAAFNTTHQTGWGQWPSITVTPSNDFLVFFSSRGYQGINLPYVSPANYLYDADIVVREGTF